MKLKSSRVGLAFLSLAYTVMATYIAECPKLSYSTTTGYFLQDVNSTDASTFNYTTTNFGLIDQTYPNQPPTIGPDAPTQWRQFAVEVARLQIAEPAADYKILFLGRHGEGYHNVGESFYGTPAWNCYWSLRNGNGTDVWADAHLTPTGVAQAQTANAFWKREIVEQRIPTPDSFYVSPLTRCLQTANVTWSGVPLPKEKPFVPTVKELLREGISEHTCDRRSSRSYIAESFPGYVTEPGLAEDDPLWTGTLGETASAQDNRSQTVLDELFGDPRTGTYVSITSHSGEIASILRVVGHREFSLSTGAVIPVLVKAEKKEPPATSVMPATASAHCTEPPVTSVSGTGCVCPMSAAPVTTTLDGSGPTQQSVAKEL